MQEILEKIKELFTENKKPVLISGILLLFFLAAAIITAFQGTGNHKGKVLIKEDEYFTPDQELFLPEGPSMPKGYSVNHVTKDRWTKDDADEYFSIPDGKILEDLEKANDKLTDEIIGSAP